MNMIDGGILVILGISCLAGFMRGLTKEILGLLTWVGSLFATYKLLPFASGIARGSIKNPMIADGITSVVLFIFFLILLSVMSGALASSVKQSHLGSVDRSLGFFFGILRTLVLLCGAEIVLSTFTLRQNQAEMIQTARFTALIRRGADTLIHWIPPSIKEFMDHQYSHTLSKDMLSPLSQKPLESVLSETLEKSLKGVDQQAPSLIDPLSDTSPSVKKIILPSPKRLEEDPEKTAESLAKLTPQSVYPKGEDGDYNTRQRRDLDRLVQINQ